MFLWHTNDGRHSRQTLCSSRRKHMRHITSLKAGLLSFGLVISLSVAGSAAAAPQDIRVRGTIISFDGSSLTVKTREGDTARIALTPGWKVSSVAKASVSDIKKGDFVGIASLPKAPGVDGALEVVIFPAALKGTGEGSHPFDLKPNSSMTNATVAKAVTAVDGRTLTLTYKGGEKKISVPNGVPVVTFATATKADLKAGAVVFIPSKKADDGSITSGRVVVGTHGVVPPM
jgi:hypothetical protein